MKPATSSTAAARPSDSSNRGRVAQLHGTYGLAIVFREYPEVLFAARLGSPLVVGVGDGEHFLASDGSPLAGNTARSSIWPTMSWRC